MMAAKDVLYKIESTPIRDLPAGMRPRELCDRVGIENVSDSVLLALIVRSGAQGMSAVEIADRMLKYYGSLSNLASASVEELAALRDTIGIRGFGKVKAQILKASLELAQRFAEEQAPEKPVIKTPEDVAALMRERVRLMETEVFWALMLDVRNRLKCVPVQISQGLLDSSLVHAREVFKEAVRSATAAIILVHNHPSGDPSPSSEDIAVTRKMIESGRILGISILDHVIVGNKGEAREVDHVSLRESGLVDFGT